MHDLEKPPLNELAHYGKKGMKWGVRKGYVKRRNVQADAAERVGQNKARLGDRIKSGTVIATRGEATAKAKRLRSHAQRIKDGQAKVSDLLIMYGTVQATDIGRQKANYGKTNAQVQQQKKNKVARKAKIDKTGRLVNETANNYINYRNETYTNAQLGGFVGALRGDPYAKQRAEGLRLIEKTVVDAGKVSMKALRTEAEVRKFRREMQRY